VIGGLTEHQTTSSPMPALPHALSSERITSFQPICSECVPRRNLDINFVREFTSSQDHTEIVHASGDGVKLVIAVRQVANRDSERHWD
ncbi:MAG: hypothetical protein KAX44_08340, partial [Candidatus Brocadiae bacterium]|nr:hypothetical protein [Candidatus Brocadiia bacterium]